MNIKLFQPQERAKNEIVVDLMSHLEKQQFDKERRYGLTAPTGSGKTVIFTKIIEEIAAKYNEQNKAIVFMLLTISKGKLAEQTISRLTTSFADIPYLNVYGSDTITEVPQDKTSVIIVNWDSLNKTDKNGKAINVLTREEGLFQSLCENIRKQNIPIILIIDESHLYSNTEKSASIRQKFIKPTYTLEVSATPKSKKWHGSTKLTTKEVADCGLIKNDIKQSTFAKSEEGIRAGAKQLQKVIKLAQETNAGYNPRMLIFLPSANQENEVELWMVLSLLENEFGWKEENGEVVVWMSNKKSKNYEKCKDNNSNCKVILTKEAIDTGVDIPAIQIIVQLRPAGNRRTELQKLGRGLRMPMQKHYGNELDKLFFFVFDDYEIDDTDADYVLDLLEDKFKIVKNMRETGRKVEIAIDDMTVKAKEVSGKAYKKVVGWFRKENVAL